MKPSQPILNQVGLDTGMDCGFALRSAEKSVALEAGALFIFDLCERTGTRKPFELAEAIERKGLAILQTFESLGQKILQEKISIEEGHFYFHVTVQLHEPL